MYKKLLPFLNKFILVRQGMLGQVYVGRLVEVDQDTLEIQAYHPDGTPSARWTIGLSTITEFLTESRQLDTLALKVKWASSKDEPFPEEIRSDNRVSSHYNAEQTY